MDKKGKIFVISAPSGAGKSTIIKRILKDLKNLKFSVSMTTRSPRPGEIDGVDYRFVNKDYFKKLIDNNELLEWAEVHNNYYGTPKKPVIEFAEQGYDVLLDIDVQGAMQVKPKLQESILIFIVPPSLEELEKRLRGRKTDNDEVIRIRLKNAEKELQYKHKYNHIIVNDELENAVSELKKVILSYKN
jgi:guanylate kinase